MILPTGNPSRDFAASRAYVSAQAPSAFINSIEIPLPGMWAKTSPMGEGRGEGGSESQLIFQRTPKPSDAPLAARGPQLLNRTPFRHPFLPIQGIRSQVLRGKHLGYFGVGKRTALFFAPQQVNRG